MDADLSAALAPDALAPPIARELGLPEAAVVGVLRLLARGDQPAFLARYRREHIGSLGIRDLERVQARAVHAVAFELKRQQLRAELQATPRWSEGIAELLATATHPVELEDARVAPRKKKRGPAAKARARGLGVLASHLWACGSDGVLKGDAPAVPDADPLALAEQHPGRPPKPRPPRPAAVEASDPSEGEGSSHGGTSAESDEAIAETGEDRAASAPGSESSEVIETADDDEGSEEVIETTADEGSGSEEVIETTADEGSGSEEVIETTADEGSEAMRQASSDDADTEGSDELAAEGSGETEAVSAEAGDEIEDTSAEASDEIEDAEPPTPSPERDLAGARTIIADDAFHVPQLLRRLRDLVLEHGHIRASVVPGKKDKGGRFARLAEHPEPLAKANPSHVLGLLRGEREGALEVQLEVDVDRFDAVCDEVLGIDASRPCGDQLRLALHEAWQGPQGRALRQAARKVLKQRIDRQAIGEFCEAYRALLLAPALGRVPVMAIDPGFAPGCRVAVLDAAGEVLARESVFPLQPKLQAPQAKARLAELALEHGVVAIVIGNGNGGRDVERLCRELVRETEGLSATVVSADADAAGVFASSRLAKHVLPEDDASMRRAISIGRRLQDPLTELAKVDPRKLGLGQHQHEVDQEELRAALEQVLISCINQLGVDPNVASVDELSRVVGFSHSLAKAVVSYREQHGPFRSRQALLDVPGVAGKTFEQSAGFLRIEDGDHLLDHTCIHPERYGQVIEMARDLGVTVGDLVGNAELVDRIEGARYLQRPGASGEPLGETTLADMLDELRSPGGDPRPAFEAVEYDPALERFEDLTVGMDLPGVITHVANFGAFVDVGLAQEGLVHVSELTHGFITNPSEAVHVGQKVMGRVIEISPDRKRFSMSLRALQPRPEGKPSGKRRRKGDGPGRGDRERERERDGDRERGDRGPGKGGKRGRKGDRGGPGNRGGGGGGGDRNKDRGDRVLGFRLDLSELAKQLDKG
ncbi:MAG: helix-hairpin-helix domain-containing protein [Myxococcales bacterium]|nr:helix-hairpin-helix domain-containing protein [Myxococcales bacterium]MCB9712857.1 helix-hairpin-helix domain-containing protein [Myxococcales bacterium]